MAGRCSVTLIAAAVSFTCRGLFFGRKFCVNGLACRKNRTKSVRQIFQSDLFLNGDTRVEIKQYCA